MGYKKVLKIIKSLRRHDSIQTTTKRRELNNHRNMELVKKVCECEQIPKE